MKALVVKKYGENAEIVLESRDKPTPNQGEALVRVYAAALNPLDLSVKSGHIPFAKNPPFILGNEGAGVVQYSSKFPEGTKVIIQGGKLGVSQDGTHQELMVVPENQLVPLPDNFSFEEGAALPVAYLTAYLALTYYGEVKKDEWVALAGATGSVGYAALQLAKALGAKPIAIVSSDEKAKQALTAQPEAIINLSQEGIVKGIARITNGQGINVALDPVGSNGTSLLLQSLAQAGRLVSIGYAAGMETTINLMDLLAKATKILGFSIYAIPEEVTLSALQHIIQLAEEEKIRPVIDSTFSLEQWGQAISRLTSRKAIGKIIFTI
ncbi:zinc-binding dehydrogenase [Peribacillus frigoritolerans]|uniref:quinone oxidoreductase family protein n=1 Tax=Peribacillus frigoritolerans TaxID=450367 RepID=UPI0021A9979D|nr:zinc-binding dehydrogenase [Peribacillus frigoritolerans]MCT4475953.1 zinc-binding dehydrogenase [Peribacillus frigoritolerans]